MFVRTKKTKKRDHVLHHSVWQRQRSQPISLLFTSTLITQMLVKTNLFCQDKMIFCISNVPPKHRFVKTQWCIEKDYFPLTVWFPVCLSSHDTKTKNGNQKTKNDEYKNTKRNNENAEKKTNKTWKRRQKEKGNHLPFPSLSPQLSSHKYLSTFLIQSSLVSKHFVPLYRRKSTCYRIFLCIVGNVVLSKIIRHPVLPSHRKE